MEPLALEISTRSELGSSASRRYLKVGSVPAVVYFGGSTSIPTLVNARAFIKLAQQTHSSRPILLRSEDGRLNGKYVVVKEIQKNYLEGTLKHVDLHLLQEDHELEIEVLVKPQGLPLGVKNEGGILAISCRTIRISCLPKDLPEFLEVDVSELHLGQGLHARDVKLPQGVKLRSDSDLALLAVVSTKKAHMEEAVAVEAPVAEAAAEGAEGATPAEAVAEGAGSAAAAAESKEGKEKSKS